MPKWVGLLRVMVYIAAMSDVASPCTGLCQMNDSTELCLGCRRTIEEIMAWPDLSPEAKRAVLAQLATRAK
jgi:predicted Fe-S protein YdhL (DUF1289 family)